MAKPKGKMPKIVSADDLRKLAKQKGNLTFAQNLLDALNRAYKEEELIAAMKRAYEYLLSWTGRRPSVPDLMSEITVAD